MRVLISAAEASSDAHGAQLLKALQERQMGGVQAFGIGGPKLQAAGLKAVVDARELLAMGFVEVLGHLPRISSALKEVTEAAAQNRPDVAVFIDYPDFHFRLGRRLKKLGIPLVYYIPPKVWAWRKGRVKFLREFFDRILCILPFEEGFYRDHNVDAKFVGNPLVDELPLDLTREEARKRLGLSPADRVVVLMPGSRASELKYHLKLMVDSASLAADKLGTKLHVLLPFPSTADFEALRAQISQGQGQKQGVELHLSQGNAHECLVAADAGLIKSGTSTLEAGLLRCPHVVVYKPSASTAWIFKHLIRYRGPVGLVNLAMGWKPGQDVLVPEILCEQVTRERLATEIVSLLEDRERRAEMLRGFEVIRERFAGPDRISPSQRAAEEIFHLLQDLRRS